MSETTHDVVILRDLCAKQQETIDRLTAAIARLTATGATEKPTMRMKVRDAVQRFLDFKRGSANPTTYAAYVNLLTRSPFSAKVADHYCDEMSHAFLQRLIDDSPRTTYIKNFIIVLRTVLKYARVRELCSTPPEDHVPFAYGKIERRNANKELDTETVKILECKCMDWMGKSDGALAVSLGLMCGLRIGEVGGLMWSDYDSTNQTLTIQRARKQTWTPDDGYKALIGPPKTRTSQRVIPVPTRLVPIFAAHADEPGYCFHVKIDVNKPMGIRDLRDKVERFITSHVGVGHFTFHSLRHTFVSRRIREGKNIKAVSAYVGHADIKITLGTYTHLNQSDLKEAIT